MQPKNIVRITRTKQVAYIVIMIVIGGPLYLMEAIYGQFNGQSKTCFIPAMKGLKIAQAFTTFFGATYYCLLMTLNLFQSISSLQYELPSTACRPEWDHCISLSSNKIKDDNVANNFSKFYSKLETRIMQNSDVLQKDQKSTGVPPSKLMYLFISSAIISVIQIKFYNASSAGQAANRFLLFRFLTMISFVIIIAFFEDGLNGIADYLWPNFESFLEPIAWYNAIMQCFSSLSICLGPIINYTSYNDFKRRVDRDVKCMIFLDLCSNVIQSLLIFGTFGNLIRDLDATDVTEVVLNDISLLSIFYPDAFTYFTLAPKFFSTLFFFMMFVFAAGNCVSMYSATISTLKNIFPTAKTSVLISCSIYFGSLINFVYLMPNGLKYISLSNYYFAIFMPLIYGIMEVIFFFLIYGIKNFLNDAEYMLEEKLNVYWRCNFITMPIFLVISFIYICITKPLLYNHQTIPIYAYGIGWLIFILCTSPIFYNIYQEIEFKNKTLSVESIKRAFRPIEDKWGPQDRDLRKKWKQFLRKKKSTHQR